MVVHDLIDRRNSKRAPELLCRPRGNSFFDLEHYNLLFVALGVLNFGTLGYWYKLYLLSNK